MSDSPSVPPEVVYLVYDEILEIHTQALNPGEPDGILHPECIESALARPQLALFGVEQYPTIWEKAACLLHSLARIGHAFMQGNHRTAARAAVVFLRLNGHDIDLDRDPVAAEAFIRAVGDGGYDGGTGIQDIAARLQDFRSPRP